MIPQFYLTEIKIGLITIQGWGLFVALGILTAIIILLKIHNEQIVKKDKLLDLLFWMFFGGFLFARFFHVLFYEPRFYFDNLIEILIVWHGGLSSFGGIVGAIFVFTIYVLKKKINKEKILILADEFSFAGLFGWVIGRLGCVAIHDHLGRLSNSWIAWQTHFGARLEMAFLEIIFLLPLAVIFLLARKKVNFIGFYFYLLLSYYGLLRFILDFFRATDIPEPDARFLGLTPAQYFGILCLTVALFFYRKSIWNKRKIET